MRCSRETASTCANDPCRAAALCLGLTSLPAGCCLANPPLCRFASLFALLKLCFPAGCFKVEAHERYKPDVAPVSQSKASAHSHRGKTTMQHHAVQGGLVPYACMPCQTARGARKCNFILLCRVTPWHMHTCSPFVRQHMYSATTARTALLHPDSCTVIRAWTAGNMPCSNTRQLCAHTGATKHLRWFASPSIGP